MGILDRDLMQPSALGAAPDTLVELEQTHTSWVFLTPDQVFKVKKPVDFGFLDFTTLEKRRLACVAEVDLNARLTPSAYLGVVPVRRDASGQHRVSAHPEHGEIVDYAVHMRRLPHARRADVLLTQGRLTVADVEAVGRRLADFHATARVDAHTLGFGKPSVIETNVVENFLQTGDAVHRFVDEDLCTELESWQLEFLRSHGDLFEGRIAARRVRDGHGDLRPEHLYFLDGGAIGILDCIEFNERFRFADVCADVAFLSMELDVAGRRDLAEAFLAAYAQHAQDYDLYALVDFYESYRAYVRGKLGIFVARTLPPTSAEGRLAAQRARRYFLLALAAKRPPLASPLLLAVGGVIASGKTTLSHALAVRLHGPVVDSDRTRKHLLGVDALTPVHHAAYAGAYSSDMTGQVYQEMLRRAELVLHSGRPVVLDASFQTAAFRARAHALAQALHLPFFMVECQAPRAVCLGRLEERARQASVSDGRPEVFDAFLSRYQPITELDDRQLIRVDTTATVSAGVERVLHRVDGAWAR